MVNGIPKLKKPMDHLFVAALPRFEGVRPNNLLVAGATNHFKLADNTQGWLEGYCRFFPRNAYYGEYWILVHPKQTSHLSWGAFVHDDSSQKISVGFGARLLLF